MGIRTHRDFCGKCRRFGIWRHQIRQHWGGFWSADALGDAQPAHRSRVGGGSRGVARPAPGDPSGCARTREGGRGCGVSVDRHQTRCAPEDSEVGYRPREGTGKPDTKWRRPTCACPAYRWPHRPGGGLCRWPDQPAEVCETPAGTNRPAELRRRGTRRRLIRDFGLHPIRDRRFIDWVLPSLYEGAMAGWFPSRDEMATARVEFARLVAGIDAPHSEQSPPNPPGGVS